MWVCNRFFFLFVVLTMSTNAISAEQIRVGSMRYLQDANQSKIVLKVTDLPKHRVFVLDNPPRLVIDVKNAKAGQALSQPSVSHPLFSHARTSLNNATDLRIVVDLKQPVTAKTYKLATKYADSKQLIINLLGKQAVIATAKNDKKSEKSFLSRQLSSEDKLATANSKNKHVSNKKRFIVAIDAGHGGDDPGAKGPNGTYEKQVTLAIARKLQDLINGQAGMKAKLIRKGDYYVGLRERMKLARLARADLFISIHADAVDNPEVKGASVYTLSSNGASSEAARWLANNENAKEKVGGVNLDDKDEVLASVLLDLSQTATQQASVSLAGKVLRNFQSIGSLHYDSVQKAGFAVLKSPDIPSILVETAYISNPADELNLKSERYQTKMAQAIFKGVTNYFEQIEPADLNRMAKL